MGKKPEWRHPRPGELLFHIKWEHNTWVSSSLPETEHVRIHKALHEEWPHATHTHVTTVQEPLPVSDEHGFW